MEYYKPVGEIDPNASYSNGNAGAGIKGSIPDARAIEHPMREILAVIAAASIAPAEGTLTQLRDAINALITTATPDSSLTVKGKVELATTAEAQALTDAVRAITPATLASVTSTLTRIGLAELATDAEVIAGTDTARIVTPAGLVAGFVQSKAANGYVKLPGGIIIQWGTATTNVSGIGAITFPLAFPTAAASWVGTALDPGGSVAETVTYQNLTTTAVNSICTNSAGGAINAITVKWLAIGY